MAAARRCFEGGQSVGQIARSAKKSPSTVRRWLRTTGLRSTRRQGVEGLKGTPLPRDPEPRTIATYVDVTEAECSR